MNLCIIIIIITIYFQNVTFFLNLSCPLNPNTIQVWYITTYPSWLCRATWILSIPIARRTAQVPRWQKTSKLNNGRNSWFQTEVLNLWIKESDFSETGAVVALWNSVIIVWEEGLSDVSTERWVNTFRFIIAKQSGSKCRDSSALSDCHIEPESTQFYYIH